jgi:hypothetical protein
VPARPNSRLTWVKSRLVLLRRTDNAVPLFVVARTRRSVHRPCENGRGRVPRGQEPALPQPENRIERQLGARLGDRDRAVVVGNVVDAGLAAGEREQCRVRGRIDVKRWLT